MAGICSSVFLGLYEKCSANSLECYTILALVVINIYFFFSRAIKQYKFWIFHMESVPDGSRILFSFGSYHFTIMKKRQLSSVYAAIYAEYKWCKYIKLFNGWKQQIVIKDVEMVNKVLETDREYFKDRATECFDNNTAHFAHVDKSLLKCASYLILHAVEDIKRKHLIILNCAKAAEDLIELSYPRNPVVESRSLCLTYALDVISSIFFGSDLTEIFRGDIHSDDCIIPIFGCVINQEMRAVDGIPVSTALMKRTTSKHYNVLFKAAMEEGQVNNYEGNECYYKMLVNLNRKRNKYYLNKIAIHAASKVFGVVSLASEWETTMSFCLYELATNPRSQVKLQQALEELPDISYENVLKCEYLDMVVREILRKYPPVRYLQRECIKNYQMLDEELDIPSVTIKKGTQVIIPIQGIQNDPNIYPLPCDFDPERFSEDNKEVFDPLAYMPFGIGPTRTDTEFTMLVVKTGLASLLLEYWVSPVKGAKAPEMEPYCMPPRLPDLWLDFEQRG